MKSKTIFRKVTVQTGILLFAVLFLFCACSQQVVQRSGEGAVTGAAVGAVGGMVSALVFGGDVGDAAARGAVWGGSTGAASGAISGAAAESNEKDRQAKELEALQAKLGPDAYKGLEALVQCKHDAAQANGRTAAKSDNKDYALAGLWVQVLAYADSRQEEKARALFPDLVSKDGSISSESQAETEMRSAVQELMAIRKKFNLPTVCT